MKRKSAGARQVNEPAAPSVSRICDLPGKIRPRELAMEQGVEHVSDEILLAILLRTGGRRGQSVLDLARRLLRAHHYSLDLLADASVEELVALADGIGPVKALELRAALELGRRAAAAAPPEQWPLIREPSPVVTLLGPEAETLQQEVFWILPLNVKYRLLRSPIPITRGLLNASLVHPREVFREAIRATAAAVILAHNHPSGDPRPSTEDLQITRRLVEVGRVVGIPVLDHIILGGRRPPPPPYESLRDSGAVSFDHGSSAVDCT